MSRHAIADCAHRMFPDPEMQIAALVAPPASRRSLYILRFIVGTLEVAFVLQNSLSRRIQVRRSSQQRREFWRDCIHDFARCCARCHALGIGWEGWEVLVPIFRQLSRISCSNSGQDPKCPGIFAKWVFHDLRLLGRSRLPGGNSGELLRERRTPAQQAIPGSVLVSFTSSTPSGEP